MKTYKECLEIVLEKLIDNNVVLDDSNMVETDGICVELDGVMREHTYSDEFMTALQLDLPFDKHEKSYCWGFSVEDNTKRINWLEDYIKTL